MTFFELERWSSLWQRSYLTRLQPSWEAQKTKKVTTKSPDRVMKRDRFHIKLLSRYYILNTVMKLTARR